MFVLEENSEKLTINVSTVDLGKIDYLVKNGFYGNRTDFLRSAIKSELKNHDNWMNKETVAKAMQIGNIEIDEDELEAIEEEGEYADLVVMGKFTVAPEISLEDLKRFYRKITVYGKIQCSDEIKEYYKL